MYFRLSYISFGGLILLKIPSEKQAIKWGQGPVNNDLEGLIVWSWLQLQYNQYLPETFDVIISFHKVCFRITWFNPMATIQQTSQMSMINDVIIVSA